MTPLSRREFLQASLAGAGLTLVAGVGPWGPAVAHAKEESVLSPAVWLKVRTDGSVLTIVNKSEMGQGVYTSLPMIMADELDTPWETVELRVAPAGKEYKDPVWDQQATGGSTSVRHMEEPLRKAAASARQMLVQAGADMWGVPAGECRAEQGMVRHPESGRSLPYGELAAKAAALPVPENPPLKEPADFTLRGKPLDRLDVPAKVAGRARFGIDVFVEGMLYAAMARPPAYGAGLLSFDEVAARKVPGVKAVAPLSHGVAVCAESIWAAQRGRDALNAKWSRGTEPSLSSASLAETFHESLAKKGVIAENRGDAAQAVVKADARVESTYLLPYLAHVTMEPMNATAHVQADRCEVWVPTQNQTGVLEEAGKISGLPPEKIQVHTTFLGCGLGRRYERDFTREALEASKTCGKPVKLIWSREQDIHYDFYRPANAASIRGSVDQDGRITGWAHKVAAPSIFARAIPEMMKGGVDPAAVEGVKDLIYDVENLYVEYVRVETPVPVGFWRSVGHSHNAFTVESFVDELAEAAGRDPLALRLDNLKNNPDARRVLSTVAEMSDYGRPRPDGRALGVAVHASFGSTVAQAAEVSVDSETGVTVHRVWCAVDSGKVINPAIVKAQMRGGIIMGLSAALMEEVAFKDGGPRSGNFDTYPILRMGAVPEIEVEVTPGGGPLGGIGEPGVPPIAPAVSNAVFAAAGIRFRTLPMNPQRVKEEMKRAGKAA
jgi:isoquinoline 1-oxidoreductase beta subunit